MNLWKALTIILCFITPLAQATRPYIQTYEVTVKKGEVYQGVQFPEGTKLTIGRDSKAVMSGELSRDFRMNGHLIKANTYFQIWDDGVIFEIVTQEGQKINNLTFLAGEATIRFDRKGVLETLHLKKPKAFDDLTFAENTHVLFHPNGKLAKGTLAKDQSRGTLNFKGQSEIQFYPSGQIKQAKLASVSTLGQMQLVGDPNPANPGETEFWPDGRLKAGRLSAKATIKDFVCGPGDIALFENGNLQSCTLGEDRKIILNPYPDQAPVEKAAKAGDKVNLNEKGVVMGWGRAK